LKIVRVLVQVPLCRKQVTDSARTPADCHSLTTRSLLRLVALKLGVSSAGDKVKILTNIQVRRCACVCLPDTSTSSRP
jgi:hypothetical protein